MQYFELFMLVVLSFQLGEENHKDDVSFFTFFFTMLFAFTVAARLGAGA